MARPVRNQSGPKIRVRDAARAESAGRNSNGFPICGQRTDGYPSALSVAVLRSPPKYVYSTPHTMPSTRVARKFIAPSNQRNKLKIRISKSETNSEINKFQIGQIQNTNPKEACLEFYIFLNLFRISCVEFVNFYIWRPIDVAQGMLCARYSEYYFRLGRHPCLKLI